MDKHTPQEMTNELKAAFDRLWWVISLLDTDEIENGVMPDGWPPKVLIGQIAAWATIHTRRLHKVARPDQVSFLERNNGGITTSEDLERLRQRDTMRAAVDARVPLDSVLADLQRAQEWGVGTLTDVETDIGRMLASPECDPQMHVIFAEALNDMQTRTRLLRRWAGSMQRWKKRDFLALLERQHELLMDSIAGLDEETILNTITHAPWSMRDELVHVLAWNEFELKIIDAWPNAQASELRSWLSEAGESEDEINERLAAERIDMNMIDVVDALATVHRRTMKRLEAMDEAGLASEGDWFFGVHGELSNFAYAMALHQAEHSEWLWKTRLRLEE